MNVGLKGHGFATIPIVLGRGIRLPMMLLGNRCLIVAFDSLAFPDGKSLDGGRVIDSVIGEVVHDIDKGTSDLILHSAKETLKHDATDFSHS